MANTKKYRASSVSIPSKKIADVPDAPTIGTATDVGTSQAYNNGSATVAYTAAPTGGTVTTFTATSTPGSFTATGASPITVTGLQSATSYTFAVSAANSSGTLTSSSTSAITATTVPQTPTIGTFTDGGTGTTGTLSFTAGATGGKSITNYKYSTDSSTYTAFSPAQTTSPLSLTGLTPGTYNFSVKAVNANGDSSASGTTSGTVVVPTSFYNIATLSLSGVTSATFSSIPQTYKSLHLRFNTKTTAGNNNNVFIRLNGDSTSGNYRNHSLFGDGSAVTAQGGINLTAIVVGVTAGGAMNPAITDIHDYTSTSNNKTVRSFVGRDDNGAGGGPYVGLWSGAWYSTSAVTSLTIVSGSGLNYWTTGSTVSLYGVN